MKSLNEAIKKLDDVAQAQAWAKGCDQCKYGVVLEFEFTGAVALYAERLVHAVDGDVTFCACRAGHMARQHMLRLYRARQTESKAEGTGDLLGAFDEVVWARQKIAAAYEMMATQEPSVHGAEPEGERVTA